MTVRSIVLLIALHVTLAAAILAAGIVAGHADPARYRAVALVCPRDMPAPDCDRDNALDIIANIPVPTPFACMMGGMGAAAFTPGLAAGGYIKIRCEAK